MNEVYVLRMEKIFEFEFEFEQGESQEAQKQKAAKGPPQRRHAQGLRDDRHQGRSSDNQVLQRAGSTPGTLVVASRTGQWGTTTPQAS
jgi:hypothetical protein